MPRVTTFRELRVYQAAYEAAMAVYNVSLEFPHDERYSLTSQIRRSSRSVAANLAEAWRKRRYPGAFVAKLTDAEAEAAETRAHLDFALGCEYLDPGEYARLDRQYARITRQVVRMIHQAPQWAPGRVGRKVGGRTAAPPHPQTPPPREAAVKQEDTGTPNGREPPPVHQPRPPGGLPPRT